MKQVNTVESSKGGGMRRLARIVMGVLLDMDAKANEVAKAPLTPCSWVSEGSQCCLFIIDFLNKVADSTVNYSKPGHCYTQLKAVVICCDACEMFQFFMCSVLCQLVSAMMSHLVWCKCATSLEPWRYGSRALSLWSVSQKFREFSLILRK